MVREVLVPPPRHAWPRLVCERWRGARGHRLLHSARFTRMRPAIISAPAVERRSLWGLLHGRPALCGWSLGLAAVYKVTPAIFLPYLIWKRQWRAAGWMAASSVFFCVLPAVFLGWQKDVALHQKWFGFIGHSLALADPSENGVEVPVLRNQSLPLALARMVQDYPVGHPLYLKTGAAVRLASLDAAHTKQFVRVVLLAVALALAWQFRRRVDLADGGVGLANEWAAVCILVALLSPLCWLQHMVLVIPAALLFAHAGAAGELRRWQWCVGVFAAALALVIHRDLIGEAICDVFSSYQPHTMAAMLLMTLVLSTSHPAVAATVIQETDGADLDLDADHSILSFPSAGPSPEQKTMPPGRERRAKAA